MSDADRPLGELVQIAVVVHGSLLESTPEGQFRMDRLRMRHDEARREVAEQYGEQALALCDDIAAREDEAFLWGG